MDPFLTDQEKAIVEARPVIEYAKPPLLTHETAPQRQWYKGAADGSFDGTVKVADMRGALPLIMLVLTAGGAEIECVCREGDKDDIRGALDRRARVFGRAIYDGTSGLPRRVEVRKIEIVKGSRDLTRWRGAFEPFDLEVGWVDNEDATDAYTRE